MVVGLLLTTSNCVIIELIRVNMHGVGSRLSGN